MKYLFLLFFVIACQAQKNKGGVTLNYQMPLTLIVSDSYSNHESPKILVVQEQATLDKFFAIVNKTRKPGLAVPKIDFEKEMLIIYALGAQNSDTMPQLTWITETDQELRLQLSSIASKNPIISRTSPFAVYSMKTTSKNVRFLEN